MQMEVMEMEMEIQLAGLTPDAAKEGMTAAEAVQ